MTGVVLLLSVAPSAAGQTVAASGGCNGDNEAGPVDVFEEDEADVGVYGGSVDLADAVDAGQALGNFAEGQAGLSPTNACGQEDSWLGVYAEGTWVACYDGSVTVADQAVTGDGPNQCNPNDKAGSNNNAVTCDDDDDGSGADGLDQDGSSSGSSSVVGEDGSSC